MLSVISLATTTCYILMIYSFPLGNLEKIAALVGLIFIKGADYKWGRKDESVFYETRIMPAFVSAVEKKFGLDTRIFTKDDTDPQKLKFNDEAARDLQSYIKEKEEKNI